MEEELGTRQTARTSSLTIKVTVRGSLRNSLAAFELFDSHLSNTTNTNNDDDTAVFFEGGGVWNQNAATDFQLYNQSYGTRLRRGNDHSFINVLI